MENKKELKDNGNVWTTFPPEAAEQFLEGAEFGKDHPSRIAVKAFLTKVAAKKTWKLLDIPSGCAVDYPNLKDTIVYHAMDKTTNLIDAVKAKYPDVPATLGDIRNIPAKDNEYEVVQARAIFEHLCDEEDVALAMKECLRVASKYAIFAFYLPLVDKTLIRWNGAYYENLYSAKAIRAIVESLGAKKVEEEFVDVSGKPFTDSYTIFYLTK
jgi:ubiquinone/menaquinone biosynthesis C-methylase UbiE